MTASLLQLQILTICALVSCARFYVGAFQLKSATVCAGRFFVFFLSTAALFVAAVI